MVEILKSRGIICFFIFIIVIGMLSSSSLSSMRNNSLGNESLMDEIIK